MTSDLRLLTDIDVGQQRGGQTEDEHQDVGHGQIDDEVVGDVAHARRPTDDGHHQQVADQSHQEHHGVREAVDGRHGGAVPVPELAGADAAGAARSATTAAGAVVLVHAVPAPGHRGSGVAAASGPAAGPVTGHPGRRGAGLGGRHRRQHVEQRVAEHVHQARFDDHRDGCRRESCTGHRLPGGRHAVLVSINHLRQARAGFVSSENEKKSLVRERNTNRFLRSDLRVAEPKSY